MPAKSETSEERRAYKREWDRKNRVGKRHQVWTGIFYEDTSPDWREEIEELCVPVCVSPLHDRDVWTARDVYSLLPPLMQCWKSTAGTASPISGCTRWRSMQSSEAATPAG